MDFPSTKREKGNRRQIELVDWTDWNSEKEIKEVRFGHPPLITISCQVSHTTAYNFFILHLDTYIHVSCQLQIPYERTHLTVNACLLSHCSVNFLTSIPLLLARIRIN
jgi:hypothetical protein